MKTKDAIRAAMDVSTMVFRGYLSDLEDSELMRRPGKGCNHLAWQCGHLIVSENSMLEGICPGKGIELPEGFSEAHSKDNAESDDAASFLTKDQYLTMMDTVRAATLSALDELPAEQLDAESPEHFRKHFPTVGHVLILIATHSLMHAGQIVPLRRELDKPVMF